MGNGELRLKIVFLQITPGLQDAKSGIERPYPATGDIQRIVRGGGFVPDTVIGGKREQAARLVSRHG